MIQALFFDLDNTLYSYDEAHAAAWRALTAYAQATLGVAPAEFEALHEQGSKALRAAAGENSAAVHNRLLRYQLMLEAMGRPIDCAPAMASLYWTAFLGAMRVDPEAKPVLRRLRESGFLLGVGTNMTAEYQFEKLSRMGLLSLVDFLVTSEEVSAEKPAARLFARCAEKAGCEMAACAFVGDSLRGDALGARDAGMTAIWLNPSGKPVPEDVHSISRLAELPDLVAAMCARKEQLP